jgi:hypothetical protein
MLRLGHPHAVGLLAALCLGAPAAARADDNDLVLARLGAATPGRAGVVPQNQLFRSLVSELGVVIAPQLLTPSDTLGWSGFQFSAQLGLTSIDSAAPYWCATEESADCNPGFKKAGAIPTVGIWAHKGFWFPVPSFEIGAGAVHVGASRLWAAQAYGKLAIHEGYHDWPIPSVAVRGAVSRLTGTEQLDLTVASFDISISKRFAVQGTFTIAPYGGWDVLWIIPRSQVIDFTPNVAVRDDPNDIRNNFVFPDQESIVRQRFFLGAKLRYYVFALTAEADFVLSGGSVDSRSGTPCDAAPAAQQGSCDATDQAGGQTTYLVSASLDF